MPDKPRDIDHYLEVGCGRCKYGGTPDCKVRSWTSELVLLRAILEETDLASTIKWSAPCYTHGGRNILMLSALKESVVVSFFDGAQLSDPEHLLEKPGENSRFARYMRFTDTRQIAARKAALLNYIVEAIALKKQSPNSSGPKSDELPLPNELKSAFERDGAFEDAFAALTPGRRRGYLLYFSSAKQTKTRANRIEKCKPKILEGKGWNER